jgi:DNA excision repair protein ERCC-2
VSVRELAGTGAGAAAVAGTPLGHGRLLLGQQVHDRYRARARREHEGYRQEVVVRWEGVLREQAVRVEGRLDGLRPEFVPGAGAPAGPDDDPGEDAPVGWVVQEIKSVLAAEAGEGVDRVEATDQLQLDDLLEDLPDPLLESYRWQCRLYCHLLAQATDAPAPPQRLRGELVMVDVRSLEARVLPVDYDPAECQAFLEQRLEQLLAERAEAERLARVRARFAEDLRFPFSAPRPHQAALMDNVAGAAESGLALLISAPTGIGKTVAALVPLTRASLAADRRLMVVTAKVSQQELALDTLKSLVPRGAEIVVSQLEARERSCPREEMLCTIHACPLLRNAVSPAALEPIRARLVRGGVFRADELRELAAAHRVCPFEVGLLAAELADVTVGDFNYAFHPQAKLERFFAPEGQERVLLIDEAHNLPSRARDFLSPALSRGRLRQLAEGAMHGAHPVFQRILEFMLEVQALLEDAAREVDDGPRRGMAVAEVGLDPERTAALQTAAEAWLLDYLAWAKSGERRPAAFVPKRAPGSRRIVDPFVSFCYDLLHFCAAAEERGDHMTALLRRSTEDTELKIFCKDPSRYLASRHRRFHAVVAMSATLEPLPFFADELGLSRLPRWERCAFPSPFPAAHRRILVDTSVSTRFRQRDQSLPGMCTRVAALAAARPGNYLAFFPSYALLQTAALLIQAAGARGGHPLRVVSQRRESGAAPVLEALTEAAADRDPGAAGASLVACAVIGGALSEGVDFPGELAVGAFIFGPGLPAVTDERQLIKEYYDGERHAGFEYAFLYPGLARVVQAAGRVIRGPTERGVIVLFGARFAEPRYHALLPEYWQKEAVCTEDPLPAVQRFWAQLE